eukprot:g11279.t1
MNKAVAFHLQDVLGLVTILIGLGCYRWGSRQLKRQLKAEATMPDQLPSPSFASPESPGESPDSPGVRPRGSEWKMMPVFATGSLNSGQPQFVLVHAPKPKARSADQVRRSLIGRVGVASPLASPQFRHSAGVRGGGDTSQPASTPAMELDDVDAITVGKYVYWMGQDDDIPRGHLGEVTKVDGDDRKVSFPDGSYTIPARKLNVCNLQNGTFVHMTRDGISSELIGEVKGLEEDSLQVEIKGPFAAPRSFFLRSLRKYLIRSELQPHRLVYRSGSDFTELGRIYPDVNEEGQVKVKFGSKKYFAGLRDLVRAPVQLGTFVMWMKADDEVARGEIGVVKRLEDGQPVVKFPNAERAFRPHSLIPISVQKGDFVTWDHNDDDVPEGHVGQVVGLNCRSKLAPHKPFRWQELHRCPIQPGNFVTWVKEDSDIPDGDLGEVVRMSGEKIAVQWPQGRWSMAPTSLERFAFQKGDRVRWSKADEDIPEGSIGQVMGIHYDDDGRGKDLFVNFPMGRWRFAPESLVSLNWKLGEEMGASSHDPGGEEENMESINRLKSSFRRFDENGDGRISPEELTKILTQLGNISEEDWSPIFDSLDRDGDGKLSVEEFVHYIFEGERKSMDDGVLLHISMADAGSLLEEKMDEKTFVTKAQWQEVVMQTCTDPENQSRALDFFDDCLIDLENSDLAQQAMNDMVNGCEERRLGWLVRFAAEHISVEDVRSALAWGRHLVGV